MSTRFLKLLSPLLLCCLLLGLPAKGVPRILRSTNTGGTALWLSLKKEAKGQYELLVNKEGQKEPERFKLTADSTAANNGVLKFAAGEEQKATAALKGYEDVIAHTATNDAEATGDAGGDISTFVNGVLRKEEGGGLLILPANAQATEAPAASGSTSWLMIVGALVLGLGGGYLMARTLKEAKPLPEIDLEKEEAPLPLETGNGTSVNDLAAQTQKLKKAQKDLKEAKASLAQLTKQAAVEATKNGELEEDYKALEARLKIANGNLASMQSQAADWQRQMQQLQTQVGEQEAYFKAAANNIIRPFTDFVASSKLNPMEQSSQAIVAEQMMIMAFHYFSLVRYGSGIWDEHDIYNLQRNGPLGAAHKAAMPQGVSVDVKSGYPNLVLTLAALLRQAGANGAAMDISMRGYRFEQKPA